MAHAGKTDLFPYPVDHGCLVPQDFHLQEAAVLLKEKSPTLNDRFFVSLNIDFQINDFVMDCPELGVQSVDFDNAFVEEASIGVSRCCVGDSRHPGAVSLVAQEAHRAFGIAQAYPACIDQRIKTVQEDICTKVIIVSGIWLKSINSIQGRGASRESYGIETEICANIDETGNAVFGNYLRAILDLIALVRLTQNQFPVDIVAIPEQPYSTESPVRARVTG